MPPRQAWMFKFGCWATIVTGVVHLAGHLVGRQPPANDTERQLDALLTAYRFTFPGGAQRSVGDFMDGFSLALTLMLVTIGGVGLIVEKRARHDAALMRALARAYAVSAVTLLVISITNFFIVPTLFIAVMAVCFLVASVQAPEEV